MHDDEDQERQRQKREREKLKLGDQLYGSAPGDLRGLRRRYRVVPTTLRMQLKVRAILEVILVRDDHDSFTELFEVMVQAYLDRYGGIEDAELPSEAEMVAKYLRKQDEKDAR